MLADLDPVIIVELRDANKIDTCIQHYAAPPVFHVAPLQQGMNLLLLLLEATKQ